MTARRTLVLAATAAVVLLAVGLVLALDAEPVGWFAYAPVADATYADGVTFVSPRQRLGWGLATLGGLLVAGVAGYTVGRRARPVHSDDGAR